MAHQTHSFWHTFSRGLGLRTLLSYVPPVAVAWIFFGLYLNTLHQTDSAAFWTSLILGLGGIAVGSVIVIALILSIVPPLRTIVEITHRLQDGELKLTVPYRARHDEIGELARAIETFRQTAEAKEALQAEQQALRQQAEQDRRRVGREMAASFTDVFSKIIAGLLAAVKKQETSAAQLERAVVIASQATETASEAAMESHQNMTAVSSATEQLEGKSRQISQQTQESSAIAQGAAESAKRTSEKALQLKDAAQKIGDVVALIDKIASQTNLLALNATIEAARVGEAGKGFAVVAGEVKALANQTSSATTEITDQITHIQQSIGLVVADVSNIVETIDRSLQISQSIAEAVEHQIDATEQIATNVRTTTAHVAKVSDTMMTLGEAVRNVDTTAKDVQAATQTCHNECTTMQNEVAAFTARSIEG